MSKFIVLINFCSSNFRDYPYKPPFLICQACNSITFTEIGDIDLYQSNNRTMSVGKASKHEHDSYLKLLIR